MTGKVILVTGGLGFIGKHFIEHALAQDNYVINVDRVSYASDRVIMQQFSEHSNYQFTKASVESLEYLPPCDLIVNFAAESHVDSSISNTSKSFTHNIQSVYRLLELTRERHISDRPKLIHISTDEVYGDIVSGSHIETDVLKPSNPYSATKAAADMLIHAWGRTFDISYNIVRMTNVYGGHQHPEKLIPKTCIRLSRQMPAVLHGNGSYVRTWLHTSDAVSGIQTVIDKGKDREIYNIGGNIELTNLEVVSKLCKIYKHEQLEFVDNRPGQDVRYSLNCNKLKELGWSPKADFDFELKNIVNSFELGRFVQPWQKSNYVKIV
jgi:dTDP-glucose 4,6-dehydratase